MGNTLHTDWVNTVCFSEDGELVATGSDDKTIKIWKGEMCVRTIKAGQSEIFWVTFSKDGKHLASVGRYAIVKIWDVETGICIRTFQGHIEPVKSVCFSVDGNTICTGSIDGEVKFWDVSNGLCTNTLDFSTEIRCVVFSPGMEYLACCFRHHIQIWDLKTLNRLKTLWDSVKFLSFSKNGRYLAAAGEDYSVKVWNTSVWECLWERREHTHIVWSVSFSKDSQYLASGSADKTIKIWEITTGTCLHTLTGHIQDVFCVSYDKTTLVSGSMDHSVRLWNLNNEVPLFLFNAFLVGKGVGNISDPKLFCAIRLYLTE